MSRTTSESTGPLNTKADFGTCLLATRSPKLPKSDRYTRIVTYERNGDVVIPIGQYNGGAKEIKWRQIRRQDPDPELVEAWLAHVGMYRASVISTARCKHKGCNQQHEAPRVTRQDLIDRGILKPAYRSQRKVSARDVSKPQATVSRSHPARRTGDNHAR